nr:immunoglobulin heavy chain junction region [Macaca mulatta]MOV40017.1 immunoglobulin heavy chain junction region [Macaca mulatta]MOV40263.1 immunoglobulin heavy chain junction region [Macaca mulatta]MOV40628.1 immunoglobulin heavy chain junction region [Macaca mulatta]MOV41346.1 immunoglobulin heavy chain junction region [Macaca mulatta]
CARERRSIYNWNDYFDSW